MLHETSPIWYIWMHLLLYSYKQEHGLFRSTKLLWLTCETESLGARSVTLILNFNHEDFNQEQFLINLDCRRCWQDRIWQYNFLLILALYFRLYIWHIEAEEQIQNVGLSSFVIVVTETQTMKMFLLMYLFCNPCICIIPICAYTLDTLLKEYLSSESDDQWC